MILAHSLPAQWALLHYQDFEPAMAPWTHSNGQPFPYGWGRQASTRRPGWAPPNSGNWCLWIDSDATGQAGTSDTAMSPPILADDCNPIKIKWGIGYDDFYYGADFVRMLYRLRDTVQWQPWTAGKSYAVDTVKTDSLTIAQQAESLQVAFYYTDAGTWAGWAAIDNVEVSGIFTGVSGRPTPLAADESGIQISISPNPVRGRAAIDAILPRDGNYATMIYNAAGQRVFTANCQGRAGHNRLYYDASLAGPGINLLMALSFSLLLRLIMPLFEGVLPREAWDWFAHPLALMFGYGVIINVVLAVLNMIPIPPLDGSRVVYWLLPDKQAAAYYRLEPYGMIVLMALLAFGVLGRIIGPIIQPIISLLLGADIM